MAYLGDIRENSISPEGIIWENDNRKDARYYWNGAFIDLCDLPGEDYSKTVFVTNVSSSETKATNPITVQYIKYINENNEEVYAYKAVAKQPVTSDVVVDLIVRDEFGAEQTIKMTITNGTTTSETLPTNTSILMAPPKIVTSDYNPKSDDKFNYDAVLPKETPILPMAYSIEMIAGNIDTISDDELISMLKETGEIQMKNEVTSEKFLIDFTPIAVEGLSSMSAIEMTEALIANSQDIIIVTDKKIKSIEQSAAGGINEISLWTKRPNKLNIDGVEFTVWYKRDVGQTSQSKVYDPVTNQIVGAEAKEYIIYYE
jgi:hypothetical protein